MISADCSSSKNINPSPVSNGTINIGSFGTVSNVSSRHITVPHQKSIKCATSAETQGKSNYI